MIKINYKNRAQLCAEAKRLYYMKYDMVDLSPIDIDIHNRLSELYLNEYIKKYNYDISLIQKENRKQINTKSFEELVCIFNEWLERDMVFDGLITYSTKKNGISEKGDIRNTMPIKINYKYGIISGEVDTTYNRLETKEIAVYRAIYNDLKRIFSTKH